MWEISTVLGGDMGHIIRWDGINWVGTGNATDVGYPYALAAWNGNLVVAARGSGASNAIRQYNGGTSWTQLYADIGDSTEFYQDVNAIVSFNDTLYIGGTFDNVGLNEDEQRIAKFDGQNWVSVDFPMPGSALPDFNFVNLSLPNGGKIIIYNAIETVVFVESFRNLALWMCPIG